MSRHEIHDFTVEQGKVYFSLLVDDPESTEGLSTNAALALLDMCDAAGVRYNDLSSMKFDPIAAGPAPDGEGFIVAFTMQ